MEGIARIYDYSNPKCDLMTNEVFENVDFFLKKQICDAWDNQIQYLDPITNLSSLEPNQHYSTLNINDDGFRGPEISKKKTDGSYRIFVVGGSTTFAVRALSDQHTIPGYLQENFNPLELNIEVEVVNAGIPNISSTDEVQLIKTKIENYDPDLLIIYDGVNDIFHHYGFTKAKIKHVNILENTYKKYFSFYKTPYMISSITETFNNPQTDNQTKIIRKGPFEDYVTGSKASLWKDNMIEICKVGKQKGFKTIVVLQPFLGTGNKTLTEHEKKTFDKMTPKFYSEYQLFAKQLKEIENVCDGTLDLRNIFDGIQDSVYFDRAHITNDYNKLVADKIYEFALPLVKKH